MGWCRARACSAGERDGLRTANTMLAEREREQAMRPQRRRVSGNESTFYSFLRFSYSIRNEDTYSPGPVFGQQFVRIASSHPLLRPLFAVRQIHSFWSQPTNEFAHDQIARDWQLCRRHRSFQCGDVTGPFSLVSMDGLLKMCFVVVRINCMSQLNRKTTRAQFPRSLCLFMHRISGKPHIYPLRSLTQTHTLTGQRRRNPLATDCGEKITK